MEIWIAQKDWFGRSQELEKQGEKPHEPTVNESMTMLEDVLNTALEVDNGATQEIWAQAREKLFAARDAFQKHLDALTTEDKA